MFLHKGRTGVFICIENMELHALSLAKGGITFTFLFCSTRIYLFAFYQDFICQTYSVRISCADESQRQ